MKQAFAAGLTVLVVIAERPAPAPPLTPIGCGRISAIFDVSVPRTPRLLGRYEFEGGSASDVLVERDLAIVPSLSDLILYDVANPAAPRRMGRYKGIPSFDPKEFQSNVVVAANGRRAFVTYERALCNWST